jgi:antirestriction protein
MTNLNLKPSDIMYSQNSIGNKFKNGDQIGEVLDNIMEDRLSISKLPTIEVKCIDGPPFLNLLPIEFCEYIMSEGFRFKFVILKNFENN